MVERRCSVDGCERPAGVPGSGRGFCGRHYQRWRKYGDPLGYHEYRMLGCICSVDGCEKPVRARGWCATHYSRWRRHGTLDDVRPFANVSDGEKWCPRCMTAKSVTDFYPKPSNADGRDAYCSACVRAKRRIYYDDNHVPAPRVEAECHSCGACFQANRKNWKYCADCRGESRTEGAARRRARKVAARTEIVYRRRVFERDGWVCQLCRKRVDPRKRWPDPMSPSLDHIVPLALGGAHSYANVQLSHLLCNNRKRTGGTDQLRLIG